MTLGDVIINLGDEEFCIGLTYTALSRCKSINQLAFEPMPGFKRITCFIKRAKFLMRREEDRKLLKLQEKTLQKLADGNVLEYEDFDMDFEKMIMDMNLNQS